MLAINHLAGFGAIGSGPPITIVDDGSGAQDTGGNTDTHTFTGQSSTGPWTLLCVTHRDNSGRSIDAMDFDGQPASDIIQEYNNDVGGEGRIGAAIAIVRGSFASKTVTVNFSAAQDKSTLTILSLDNLLGSVPLWTGFDKTLPPPWLTLTGVIAHPAGIIIGLASSGKSSNNYTGENWTTEHEDSGINSMRVAVYSKLGVPSSDLKVRQSGDHSQVLVGAAFR